MDVASSSHMGRRVHPDNLNLVAHGSRNLDIPHKLPKHDVRVVNNNVRGTSKGISVRRSIDKLLHAPLVGFSQLSGIEDVILALSKNLKEVVIRRTDDRLRVILPDVGALSRTRHATHDNNLAGHAVGQARLDIVLVSHSLIIARFGVFFNLIAGPKCWR